METKANTSGTAVFQFFGTAAVGIFLLFLSFYMGLLPKNDSAYPTHVDEWIHYDQALRVHNTGRVARPLHVEAGFHVLLATMHGVTGLDWLTLFRWLPPTFFAATVFLCYLVGRRFGCGLESAALATLIPTTVRFLGPAFLVPVALGLLMLPFLLVLLQGAGFDVGKSALVALTLLFVGVTHPTSAIILSLVVVVHAAFFVGAQGGAPLKDRVATGALFCCALVVPISVMMLWRWDRVAWVLLTLLQPTTPTPLPLVTDAVSKFGILPATLFFVGHFFAVLREKWSSIGLVAYALVLIVYIRLYNEFRIGYQSLADRSWFPLLAVMAIVGGYGIHRLGYLLYSLLRTLSPRIAVVAGAGLVVGLVAASLFGGVKAHRAEPYYHLVTDETIADFEWVRRYLDPEKRTALTRIDLGFAYPPLTGGGVHIAQPWPFVTEEGKNTMGFLFGDPGGRETWWRERNITLIYAPHWSDGPSATDQPRPGIFIPSSLKP